MLHVCNILFDMRKIDYEKLGEMMRERKYLPSGLDTTSRQVNFWKMLDCFETSGWLIRLRTISALGAIVKGDNLIMKRLLLK